MKLSAANNITSCAPPVSFDLIGLCWLILFDSNTYWSALSLMLVYLYFPFAHKKGPDKVLYRGLDKQEFSLFLGFRFLSFFFSFNNGVRD